MNHHDTARGIGLSVTASALFAFLSGYTHWLAPLDGLDIFSWRILWTVPVVLGVLAWHRQLPLLKTTATDLFGTLPKAVLFLAMTAMFGTQLWLFLWGSVNGRALEISLGYFLLPLVMVMVGRFYYGEQMNWLQRLSVLFALIGVAHELWMTRAFSWPTLLVALGYPPYFVLRRRIHHNSLVIFTLEMLILTPIALFALANNGSFVNTVSMPSMWLLLPGLGIASTIALEFYLRAGKLLPMGLFGILGYVEPVLLVFVALLILGETMTVQQLGTYVPIWLSVGFTAIHSVRLMRKKN